VTDDPVVVFLCGDVMLGRGVDQILPHPGDPALRERCIVDARTYVELAEAVNGPVARPVDYCWPWGDALALLDAAAPDVRVVNVETSITRCDHFAPGKGIHYRMNPANVACLTVAQPEVCVLANNHVLDFGPEGLGDTLETLAGAGLRAVGAGVSEAEACRPADIPLPGGGRVVVHSFGTPSSGIPESWAASGRWAGVGFVAELSDTAADAVLDRVRQHGGDIVIASVHWGSNWGYRVSRDQVHFAHRLLEGGVDIVHGHSSHEKYRDELRLAYFASVEPGTGRLIGLRMSPLRARQLRLCRASSHDAAWLETVLRHISGVFGCRIDRGPDGTLVLR
jgi:poly-gamma-glutamate capsule biosynthesis protein CapA/YwtB (metallophosphatase superfamily)